MKHEFMTALLPTTEGKVGPVEHGVWRMIGGTGSLARSQGALLSDEAGRGRCKCTALGNNGQHCGWREVEVAPHAYRDDRR
jgi:hypothetical protein